MRGKTTWTMLTAAVAAAVSLAYSGVSAETVEGSVRSTGGPTEEPSSTKDYYWKVWNGALPEQPAADTNDSLLAVLTGKFTGPPIGCTFSFSGGALDPSTIAARSGTTVRVENRDAFTHELSVDGLPGFTPLESGPGAVRAIPVPAGGPWRLGDLYYGHVDGYLHSIRELVACAVVSSSGRFRFDGVPPGPYSLRILQGTEQVASRRVTVPAGKTLRVDALTLKSGGK
ncbi:MAG: carboxypeptidase-like regulatory domain-containing protein [Myxococcales bacterium]|nr:carboxypeptidase-like regulatory domain-containing protein [Myxococcales bacterium]MDH3483906.1 carboxypeptidase-like regulatory domain-containing protein [Myxococcales bacterium]